MNQTLVATAEEAPREADLAFDCLYRSSRDDVYAYVAGLLRDGPAAVNDDDGSGWGVGDALDDAGHILAITGAVTIVALAVAGPIALIALLAWLAHRAWLSRARSRALG